MDHQEQFERQYRRDPGPPPSYLQGPLDEFTRFVAELWGAGEEAGLPRLSSDERARMTRSIAENQRQRAEALLAVLARTGDLGGRAPVKAADLSAALDCEGAARALGQAAGRLDTAGRDGEIILDSALRVLNDRLRSYLDKITSDPALPPGKRSALRDILGEEERLRQEQADNQKSAALRQQRDERLATERLKGLQRSEAVMRAVHDVLGTQGQ